MHSTNSPPDRRFLHVSNSAEYKPKSRLRRFSISNVLYGPRPYHHIVIARGELIGGTLTIEKRGIQYRTSSRHGYMNRFSKSDKYVRPRRIAFSSRYTPSKIEFQKKTEVVEAKKTTTKKPADRTSRQSKAYIRPANKRGANRAN